MNFDINKLPTPCYIVDENLLKNNLEILKSVIDKTGCHILLAQKAFSMFSVYPLLKEYLSGTASSGLYEAKLGYEEFGKEVHVFMPAFIEEDMDEIIGVSDHIVFNSFNQWNKYKKKVLDSKKHISCGIRINPEYAEVETELYNPCAIGSRLGTTVECFKEADLEGIEGLHFHTMCEQNSDVLKRTIKVVDEKFSKYLSKMKWINFGGGHHITRKDYDIETLIECIMYFKNKYNIEVYIEPGEAVALNTGFLVTKVLDIVNNGINIGILDTSAACHMPDVIEMPYRPKIIGSEEANVLPYTYRFGGPTCLAGDIIGDYSFKEPLKEGDKLVFTDMAIYTMVKNNTFNGMKLPTIAICDVNKQIQIIKKFGYDDFKMRLS